MISRRRAMQIAFGGLMGLASSRPAQAQTGAGKNGHHKPIWQTLPPTPQLRGLSRSGHAHINGASIWWGEYANATANRPVLLLHGGYANANYFGHLAPALARRGYHVIVMDTRGHGRSTRGDKPFSYDLFAQDVIALLDMLALKKVDVVGWSDGGNTGLDLAIHHRARISRLMTFGSNANTSAAKPEIEQTPTFQAYAKRTRKEYAALSPTPHQFAAFDAQMQKMWATEPNYMRTDLAGIHTPTTVSLAQYDEAIRRSHAVYMSDTIPRANLIIMPNVSHFAMLQNPDEFEQFTIDFLEFR